MKKKPSPKKTPSLSDTRIFRMKPRVKSSRPFWIPEAVSRALSSWLPSSL